MFTHVHTPAHILENAYPCMHIIHMCGMYDQTYEYLSCPGTHVSVCMSVHEPHRAPHTTVQPASFTPTLFFTQVLCPSAPRCLSNIASTYTFVYPADSNRHSFSVYADPELEGLWDQLYLFSAGLGHQAPEPMCIDAQIHTCIHTQT